MGQHLVRLVLVVVYPITLVVSSGVRMPRFLSGRLGLALLFLHAPVLMFLLAVLWNIDHPLLDSMSR
jgi:hypothetical protein